MAQPSSREKDRALLSAVREGSTREVRKLLLGHPGWIEECPGVWYDVLCDAARRGDSKMVKFLVDKAKVHPGERGGVALYWGARSGDLATVRALCGRRGCDPSSECDGKPLSGAVQSGNPEMVAFFLDSGANPLSCNQGALAHAARMERRDLFDMVLSRAPRGTQLGLRVRKILARSCEDEREALEREWANGKRRPSARAAGTPIVLRGEKRLLAGVRVR